MPSLILKPTHKAVTAYYDSLAKFAKFGIKHETAVRSAFQELLESCARPFDWKLVPEYAIRRKGRAEAKADGALLDNYGRTLLICLLREEVSIDDLDKGRNEAGEISVGEVRLDERKYALRIAKVSGTVDDWIVHFAITQANNKHDTAFFIELGRALARKQRPPEIDYERIGIVPRFLVDYWCGEHGQYGMWLNQLAEANAGDWRGNNVFVWKQAPNGLLMPPLCFFASSALATYCALELGKKQSDKDTSATAVRKWVSRLRLKTAGTPKIREVKVAADGICFVT